MHTKERTNNKNMKPFVVESNSICLEEKVQIPSTPRPKSILSDKHYVQSIIDARTLRD